MCRWFQVTDGQETLQAQPAIPSSCFAPEYLTPFQCNSHEIYKLKAIITLVSRVTVGSPCNQHVADPLSSDDHLTHRSTSINKQFLRRTCACQRNFLLRNKFDTLFPVQNIIKLLKQLAKL